MNRIGNTNKSRRTNNLRSKQEERINKRHRRKRSSNRVLRAEMNFDFLKDNDAYDEMHKKKRNSKESKNTYKNDKQSKIKNSKKKSSKENKKKKHGKIGRFFRRLFLLIIILLIVIGTLFYRKVQENGGGKQGIVATLLGQDINDVQNLKPINVLLLGVSEDLDSRLTDTIILCSYNPQKQKASMLSIPRDTFVGKDKNQAGGRDKINSLYQHGVDKTVKAVSKITGSKIDYYAVVNNNALIEIVDIIGGVKFDVPIDMDYDDPTQNLHIHLKKGMQKIDGEKAEMLLRFRHNNDRTTYPQEYGGEDYGRMKTQRAFMTETIKQSLNIKNAFKVNKIINTVFDNVETNVIVNDVLPYAVKGVDFNIDSIISRQLPGQSEKCNGVWVFVYDKKETKKIVEELELDQNEVNSKKTSKTKK